MIYCFDLDQTLCNNSNKDYINSYPIVEMIDRVNFLYDEGHYIKIFTARGMSKFNKDLDKINDAYLSLTKKSLQDWGVKYHELILGKTSFDYFIDDKNLTIDEFKSLIKPKVGFIAGCFDIIHPGYIHMFKTIKKYCDFLIVGLHEDPTIDRPNKIKPILSIEERSEILLSIKYVDDIKIYQTENDLENLLIRNKIDIRFLGEDYKNSNFTAKNLDIEIKFIDRNHGWSTTKMKKLIINNK